jgi:hypothetical protein
VPFYHHISPALRYQASLQSKAVTDTELIPPDMVVSSDQQSLFLAQSSGKNTGLQRPWIIMRNDISEVDIYPGFLQAGGSLLSVIFVNYRILR